MGTLRDTFMGPAAQDLAAKRAANTSPGTNYLGADRNDAIPLTRYDPETGEQVAIDQKDPNAGAAAVQEIIRRNNAANTAGNASWDNLGYKTAKELFETDPNWAAQFFKQYPGSQQAVQSLLAHQGSEWNNKGNGSILEAAPMALAIVGGAIAGEAGGAAGEVGAAGAADAIPASSAGVGVEGGVGTATAGAGATATGAGAGAVGTGGSIADSAAALNNFVNGGQWDAAMADLMGDASALSTPATTLSAQAPAAAATGSSAAAPSLAQTTTGLSTSPGAALNAPSTAGTGTITTTADAGGWLGGDVGPGGVVGPTGQVVQSGGGGGILNSVMDWGKANPMLAYGAMQLGSGVIGGIGNNITQNQLMDKKIQAEKDLLAQKYNEEEKLAEWRRRFQQSGSYFDTKPTIAPRAGGGVLRRPDGTPVYAPGGGLVTNAMQGGG